MTAAKLESYVLQARHLFDAWQSIGSPELRTICECAVGPYALLTPFEGQCRRAVFIEPDPEMASAARARYPWAEIQQVAIAAELGVANLRKLRGSSYIKGIAWAPAFDAFPDRARKAGKVTVATVPFSVIDDGMIDVLNLDCEGSEWEVLRGMSSRPLIVQIELYPNHANAGEIEQWFTAAGYVEMVRWGNANRIYRSPAVTSFLPSKVTESDAGGNP